MKCSRFSILCQSWMMITSSLSISWIIENTLKTLLSFISLSLPQEAVQPSSRRQQPPERHSHQIIEHGTLLDGERRRHLFQEIGHISGFRDNFVSNLKYTTWWYTKWMFINQHIFVEVNQKNHQNFLILTATCCVVVYRYWPSESVSAVCDDCVCVCGCEPWEEKPRPLLMLLQHLDDSTRFNNVWHILCF